MPLPHKQSSPEEIANYCSEVARFCDKHSSTLAREAGNQRQLNNEALNHASNLRSSHARVEQEVLEDYDLVTRRQALVAQTQRIVRSIRAGVKLRLAGKSEAERVLNSFKAVVPSDLRTEKAALAGLLDVRRALQTHKDKLSGAVDRSSEWLAQLNQCITGFEHIANERSREDSESAEARQQRDQAREAAIDFLQEVELLVMALEWEKPELLEDWEAFTARIS